MGKLMIGWGEKSIVPDKKVFLRGQFYERISEYVESDITATALALSSGEEKMIIVSVDIVGIEDALLRRTREVFASLTDEIPPELLMFGATHSHTSVDCSCCSGLDVAQSILNEFLPEAKRYHPLVEAAGDSVLAGEEALEFLAKRLAAAAYEAWRNRAPGMYANEFGRAAVGMCRRVQYDDDTAQMWGDTNTANFVSLEGGNDSGVELLYFFDADKKLTGVAANVACPSQILEHRSFISSDYWGKVKEYLRREWGDGIYVLGLCGAGGDQCPRDLVRWVQPETPINDPNISRPHVIEHRADPSMFDLKGCRLAGRRIANEIVSVFDEITEYHDDVPFRHKVYTLDLPLRRVTLTDYKNAVREIEYYIAKNAGRPEFDFKDNAALHVYAGTIERFRRQQFEEIVPIEVHTVRLGDIALTTNPFELFLDYGNQIKARSYAKQTFIVQLSCGDLGYLPTEKAEGHGHYSAYVSSGCIGHEGGNMLVRRSITEINEMWK